MRSSGSGTRGIPGYLDFETGMYLNTYAFTAEKPSEARFFEATGGGAGRDDQFHHVQFGRYNDWRPHETLGNQTPAMVYQTATRAAA